MRKRAISFIDKNLKSLPTTREVDPCSLLFIIIVVNSIVDLQRKVLAYLTDKVGWLDGTVERSQSKSPLLRLRGRERNEQI